MTFLLLYTFIPITLAFDQHDPAFLSYVMNTLLLVWFGVDMCGDLYDKACRESLWAIREQYDHDAEAALEVGDFDRAISVRHSELRFLRRG